MDIPPDRKFATKIELGWQMIKRVRGEGLPFEVVCCDRLYGRSYWLSRKMSGAGLVYYADVPADTKVHAAASMHVAFVPQRCQLR